MNIHQVIADEINISVKQVDAVAELFSEGATVPFITRYRKERTGGLDEDQLRIIEERISYLTLLEARKETILKSIEEQGKLTDELKEKIIAAVKLQEVEDLYLPYKPKRKTRGTIAKAKGLEPLAFFIIENPKFKDNLNGVLEQYINSELGVESASDALQGAKDIIAEMISDSADARNAVREYLFENAVVSSKKTETKEEKAPNKKDVYEVYYEFSCPINKIKKYQTLAINRGEKEGFLKVAFSFEKDPVLADIYKKYFPFDKSVFDDILKETIADSFKRLIYPSIETEIRNQLSEEADLHAIEIFAANLKQLLLQPPINNKIILGIDPGYVSGSKLAVIDTTGKYIDGKTIYPHPPQKKLSEAKEILLGFINKYGVNLIAIGNGAASRETEQMIAELIKENKLKCHYLIVNEAGASVYSASETAKTEFPDLEASQRGNISIARRVLDPLAELVKIDPKSIGVGLYQHDVNQKLLSKKLDDVVVSCVDYVGVDVNTASASLLNYVSGLNKRIAGSVVKHRDKIGKFKNRQELMEVSGMGEKAFEQCAGFLKIPGGENPLDNTFIHPESYGATTRLLKLCELSTTHINERGNLVELFVKNKGTKKIAESIGVGEPTLIDILENLKKPGRDPRDEMPKPILRSDVLNMEDLQVGMKLKGTVRNVVDFGAFVDIGVKQDGLLHISRIANRFVKNPLDVLKVGDIIEVSIISVDIDKKRISLSMTDRSTSQ